ncbi:hypothetical protein [Sutcliffiella horikoshii]|uniref:Core-binding (CB) domain-containing protein n=1 Tax=Sutcliffiella horikoshii TaxID=79883 RepID=A0A5D4TCG7_9BACI|nr:hypothetical protein [Sutcliffiella horikoshii]TYS71744.1 hypothetical protein FZC75_11315 [Sutcliffiella horikoshii]
MQKKSDFENWLNNSTSLSSSTISKYSGAINTMSKELSNYSYIEGSLYNLTDPGEIEGKLRKYLSIPEYCEKDRRGNRMYSNALKYYIAYSKELGSVLRNN